MTGATVHETHGDGPPVILIHGLGLNRHMWQWQVPALSDQFKIITYDLLGHGDSDKPSGAYEMSQMVEQIEQLMSELEIDNAAMVGFSLGGLIVRAFALAHPGKITAMVILSSAHARSVEQRDSILQRMSQVAAGGPEATVDESLHRWFTEEFSKHHPERLATVKGWVLANDPKVYAEVYRLLAEGDVGLELSIADIRCPVLIATGEEDHGNSVAMAEDMAALMPNAKVAVLSGLRHMALAEDPNAVNALLLSFLREQPGAAACTNPHAELGHEKTNHR